MVNLHIRLPQGYAAQVWFIHRSEIEFSIRGSVSSVTAIQNDYLSRSYCMDNNIVQLEFPEGYPYGGIIGHFEADIYQTETWYDPGDEYNPPATKRRIIRPAVLQVRTEGETIDLGTGSGDTSWDLSRVLAGIVPDPDVDVEDLLRCPYCDLLFFTEEELNAHLAHHIDMIAFTAVGKNFPAGAYRWQVSAFHADKILTTPATRITTSTLDLAIPEWPGAVTLQADVWDDKGLKIISLALEMRGGADILAGLDVIIDFKAKTIADIDAVVRPIPDDQRSPYAGRRGNVLAIFAVGLAVFGAAAYAHMVRKVRRVS